jgi:3-hydroxyisobutyrate dehydrogenase
MKVGFVGNGGSAILGAMRDEHEVRVIDAGAGAEAFAGVDLLLVEAGTDEEVLGLRASMPVLDLREGSPDDGRALAARFADQGFPYLDVILTGHFEAEGKQSRVVLAAGDESVYRQVAALLNTLGDDLFYCGPAGNARAVHLYNSAMSLCSQMATLEVVAMGCKLGLTVDTMAKVINSGSGRNMTSRAVLPAIVQGQSFSSVPMADALATLDLIVGVGMDKGLPSFTASITRGLLQAGVHHFGDGATMNDTVPLIERLANAKISA